MSDEAVAQVIGWATTMVIGYGIGTVLGGALVVCVVRWLGKRHP